MSENSNSRYHSSKIVSPAGKLRGASPMQALRQAWTYPDRRVGPTLTTTAHDTNSTDKLLPRVRAKARARAIRSSTQNARMHSAEWQMNSVQRMCCTSRWNKRNDTEVVLQRVYSKSMGSTKGSTIRHPTREAFHCSHCMCRATTAKTGQEASRGRAPTRSTV